MELKYINLNPSHHSPCKSLKKPILALQDIGWTAHIGTDREITSPDRKILEYLLDYCPSACKLLHVGVGNSVIAQNLCGEALSVDGITLHVAEKIWGDTKKLSSYNIVCADKHDPSIWQNLGAYTLICDSAPAAFACCMHHFLLLFQNYAENLLVGGAFITERTGMDGWTSGGSINLRLQDDDLERLCEYHELNLTEPVKDVLVCEKF